MRQKLTAGETGDLLSFFQNKIEAIIGHDRYQRLKEGLKASDDIADPEEQSVNEFSHGLYGRLLETDREAVLKIEAAMEKIGNGTYGICDDCGEEIADNRLKALPEAERCRECQEAVEEFIALDQRRAS